MVFLFAAMAFSFALQIGKPNARQQIFLLYFHSVLCVRIATGPSMCLYIVHSYALPSFGGGEEFTVR